MGRLIYDDEVDRIQIDAETWVDIKKCMSFGDRQSLTAHYLKIQMSAASGKEKVDTQFDIESGNLMLLVLNIKAWNILDKVGGIAPVNLENIKRLRDDDAGLIMDEIQKRNPPKKV